MKQHGMRSSACAGFTFVWILLMVAALGAGAAAGARVWATSAQREREAELLFVGDQFRRAIASYVAADVSHSAPRSLEDLLADKRLPKPRRHLRKLYRDPMSNSTQWGVIRIGDGIAGVYSLSDRAPLKRRGFDKRYAHFADAARVSDWKFTVDAGTVVAPSATTGAVPATASVPQGAAAPITGASAPPSVAPPPIITGTPAPAPKPSPKKDTSRTAVERQCRLIARADTNSCASIKSARGDSAGARCAESAAVRSAGCLDANGFEGALPPLVTN